jgi:hypothetical protein
MKKIAIAALSLLFFGCSQKNEIRYYLPESNISSRSAEKVAIVSVDTASYLSGDKIWYKKGSVFLPYKSSYLAKTPKEFITSELQSAAFGKDAKINLFLDDAYQFYDGGKTSFVVVARLEIQINEKEKRYKVLKIITDGMGEGADEAVKGFGKSVAKLCVELEKEIGKGAK